MAVMIGQTTMALERQLPKNPEASLKTGHQKETSIQAMVLDKTQTLLRCKFHCQGHTQASTSCDKNLKMLALLSSSLKEDYLQLIAISTHQARRIDTP